MLLIEESKNNLLSKVFVTLLTDNLLKSWWWLYDYTVSI